MFGLGGFRRDFLRGGGLFRSRLDRGGLLQLLVDGGGILGGGGCGECRGLGALGIAEAVGNIGAASGVAAVADLGGGLFGLLDAEALPSGGAVGPIEGGLALILLLLLAGLQLLLAGVDVDGGLASAFGFSYSARLASISFSRSARCAARTASSSSSFFLKDLVRM